MKQRDLVATLPVVVFAVAASVSFPALAGFILEGTPSPAEGAGKAAVTSEPLANTAGSAPIPLVPGGSPLGGGILRGFGRPLPLPIALKEIVPSTMTVRFGGEVDTRQKISWSADGPGKPWRQVLTEALRPTELTFREEKPNVVVVEEVLATASRKVPVMAVSAPPPVGPVSAPPSTSVSSGAVIAGALPPGPPPPSPVEMRKWVAEADTTLSETLRRWATESGWTLDWRPSAKDRLFGAQALFAGDFEQASESLLKLYIDGPQSLRARFNEGNKVLEVWGAGAREN